METSISVYVTAVKIVESMGVVPAASENRDTPKLPQSWVTSRLAKAVTVGRFMETGVSHVKYVMVCCVVA